MSILLKPLRHALAALLLGLSLSPAAQAQAPSVSPGLLGPDWRLLFGLGLTGGGERLVSADGGNLWSGALLHLHTGVRWEAAPWLSLQASIGLQTDSTDANVGAMFWRLLSDQRSDDRLVFDRLPVELLAHLRLDRQWALGGGWRRAYAPVIYGQGVYSGYSAGLRSRPGWVGELEYRFGTGESGNYAALVLRGVRERYLAPASGTLIDASHAGLYLNIWF
ncbi:MAG: hypothetical protein RJA44_1790 [Pseudomonadota bacterium]